MPIASMSAYTVVGPTNANPRRFSSLDSAVLSSEVVGTSAKRAGSGVRPGWYDHTSATSPSCSRSATVARTPIRREGTPADVAGAVLYLASPAASFVTGEILEMNGGLGAF